MRLMRNATCGIMHNGTCPNADGRESYRLVQSPSGFAPPKVRRLSSTADPPTSDLFFPIVDEVRKIRDELAGRFNYDLEAVYQHTLRSEKRNGKKKPGESLSRSLPAVSSQSAVSGPRSI